MDIEIKSSLINDPDFKHLKDSLIEMSKKDGEDKFRVKTIEYINDSSSENDDIFFYDMLEFVRFLDPSDNAVAYTTPEHLIYLNCPSGGDGHIGKNMRHWDFIYDHECLHQLWDTFGVGEKIKANNIEYDHTLLNIASDVVINDYLEMYRRKSAPANLWTAKELKERYGVDYNSKIDTQYSLYLKLIDLKKNDKDKYDKLMDSPEVKNMQDDLNKEQDSQVNQSSQSNKNNDEGNDSQANHGDDGGKEEKEEKNTGKTKGAEKQETEENSKSKSTGGRNDSEDDGQEGKNTGEGKGNGKGQGASDADDNSTNDEDLDKIKHKAEDVINKYKNKISGAFGEFVKKCKVSSELKSSGLKVKTANGVSGWNQQMNQYINSFVKKKVFQKKRQYESTYKRLNRRSGPVKVGDPIIKGKRIKKDSFTINVAFYIDRSGSMGGCIKDVFSAAYTICDTIKKQFGKEKVVDDVTFKMHAFDHSMHELKFGQTMKADGGTMNFETILDYITKNTKDYLINVIITDAGFSINSTEVKKLIKDTDGMILFITNVESNEMKKLAKEYETQLFYILADQNFTLQ